VWNKVDKSQSPFVSIITPVYNGEKHLEKCIQSVLNQTYPNFEYVIVNNCSTDRTLEIAESYALKDDRIKIHTNTDFLSVVDSHNKAFSLASENSEYCKIVGADDWLYPECVSQMVALAEQNPSIAMVTSYVLVGTKIGWDGLPYPSTFLTGRDVCRMRLLDRILIFGGPSASLLRRSVVEQHQPFYKPGNYHGDTEAYLDILQDHNFGFIHQVLSFNFRGEDSRTTHFLQRVDSYRAAEIEELERYGPIYLSREELHIRLSDARRGYYKFLATNLLELRGKEFWDYHHERMNTLGTPISYFKLSWYTFLRIIDLVLNPKRTVEGLYRRLNQH